MRQVSVGSLADMTASKYRGSLPLSTGLTEIAERIDGTLKNNVNARV